MADVVEFGIPGTRHHTWWAPYEEYDDALDLSQALRCGNRDIDHNDRVKLARQKQLSI